MYLKAHTWSMNYYYYYYYYYYYFSVYVCWLLLYLFIVTVACKFALRHRICPSTYEFFISAESLRLFSLLETKERKITRWLVYTFECGMVTYWDHGSVARVSNNFAYTVSLRYQYGRQDGGALFCASNFLKIFGYQRAQFRNDTCVFLL